MEDKETKYLRVVARYKARKVIDVLRKGDKSVGEIARAAGISQPNISFQVKALMDVGIIDYRQEGHSHIYFVKHKRVFDLLELLKEILAEV